MQLRVLVVEDSDDDAQLILRALRQQGFEIDYRRVETAAEMLAALAEQTWDAILSDFSLPHFNATGALAVMQASQLDLPFIIISGTISEEIAVAAMRAGAHDFVTKGNLARLGVAVRREVAEAELRREVRRTAAALREQEQRLQAVMDAAPFGAHLYELQPDGGLIFIGANNSADELLGLDNRQFLGRDIEDAFPLTLQTNIPALYRRLAQQGGHADFEQVNYEDGRSGGAYEVHAVQFGPQRVAAFFLDITTRKVAEARQRRAVERTAALAAISKAVGEATLQSKLVLDAIAEQGAALVGDTCVISLLSEEQRVFKPVSIYHPDPDARAFARELLTNTVYAESIVNQVVQTGEPLLIAEMAPEQIRAMIPPQYMAYLDHYHVYSMLVVPMRAHGQVIGIVMLSRDQPGRPYTAEDQAFLQELADRGAQAVTNVTLYSQIQARNTELSALFDLSAQLRVAQTDAAMLPIILDSARDVLQASAGLIVLSDADGAQFTVALADGALAASRS